jgi:hypothetical protein
MLAGLNFQLNFLYRYGLFIVISIVAQFNTMSPAALFRPVSPYVDSTLVMVKTAWLPLI